MAGIKVMERYEYKRITPDNLSDVVFLVKKIAQKRLSVAYYQKKYNTPRSGGQYSGWLAYEKSSGQVVSVAAALPLYGILPDGQKVPVTQMIETFTLPEHRGKGLMTFLVKKILEEHENAGTRLFFGLLNQNNVHGFVRKLGFTHTGTMEYFRLKINTFPLEALCRRCRIPGVFRWWARKTTNRYLAPKGFVLKNSTQEEGYAGVLHDAPFFAYKSFTLNNLYRFDGIDTWLKLESGLLVGDVSLPENYPDFQFDQWLSTLRKIARHTGLRQIIFQAHPDTRLGQKLSARFQAHPSWSVCCLAGDAAMEPVLAQMRFCYGDFETF
jgi:GNAT superfamily N-acetyltransferase